MIVFDIVCLLSIWNLKIFLVSSWMVSCNVKLFKSIFWMRNLLCAFVKYLFFVFSKIHWVVLILISHSVYLPKFEGKLYLSAYLSFFCNGNTFVAELNNWCPYVIIVLIIILYKCIFIFDEKFLKEKIRLNLAWALRSCLRKCCI